MTTIEEEGMCLHDKLAPQMIATFVLAVRKGGGGPADLLDILETMIVSNVSYIVANSEPGGRSKGDVPDALTILDGLFDNVRIRLPEAVAFAVHAKMIDDEETKQ